ncbi:MAG TPA: hypothetical protein VLG11_02495 [Candidatus Saccharimonadales bacterium]|nr:hypothetical protein [Candidatus Saccharimonadales bacterium]
MHKSLKNYFRGAAICFLGMVIVCISLHPSVFKYYGYGISEFGAIHATVLPFFIGFAATIYFLIRIAITLKALSQFLSTTFFVSAICLSGIAVTSSPMSRFTYDLHWWFAGTLTLNILMTMVWQLRRGMTKTLDHLLAAVFLVTVIVSLLPHAQAIPIFGDFILRESIGFIASFWFLMRATFAHIGAHAAGKRFT